MTKSFDVGLLALLVAASGCAESADDAGPPLGRLYYPTGVVHLDVPGSEHGALFVVNANLDKRYSGGSIAAIRLDGVPGLPALGAAAQTPVPQLTTLPIGEQQSVQISSFGSELAMAPMTDHVRLFVPTRSEGNRVFQVKASVGPEGPTVSCVGVDGRDCRATGVSLVPRELEQSSTALPRAPAPYGVASAPRSCRLQSDCCEGSASCPRVCSVNRCLDADGQPVHDVYFTHQLQADSPLASNSNFHWYLVHTATDAFSVQADDFIDVGLGGSNSALVKGNWVYVTGRSLLPAPNLLRVVGKDRSVYASSLETAFHVGDSRSIAQSSDGSLLYVVGRLPDMLLVLKVDDSGPVPSMTFVRAVALPDAANQLVVVPRPGRKDLVAVTCTSGGSVAVYDEDVGELVSLINGVGVQPFGITADARSNAARLFVTNHGDGRIAVIDIPELSRPQEARLVAHLGEQQLCLTRGLTSVGCRGSMGSTQ